MLKNFIYFVCLFVCLFFVCSGIADDTFCGNSSGDSTKKRKTKTRISSIDGI